ncbi:winged helix DNA-binding domain-containing protein [Streptomyces sp. URMC 123]|uniref:winged helix DNA-binding domain-containing protein n=1 Tax=Streptomyces sp. URMC 123 TaxID=3423403 RepID=UPI003F19ABA6
MPARPRITAAQRRHRLAVRHLLAPGARARTPEQVAEAVVALHSTDPATVHLSALARLADPRVEAVERALYEDRSLVRMHGMRHTLFVVPDHLAPAVQAAMSDKAAATERRSLLAFAARGGFTPELLADAERAVLDALAEHGSLSGAQLGARVPALRRTVTVSPGKPYETQQSIGARLLRVMGVEGTVVRGRPLGSWTSGQYTWAPAAPHAPLSPADGRTELVRAYLAAFGPATEADIVWWTGWTVTAVRAALAANRALAADLDDGRTGWLLPADADPVAEPEPWAALLPALDPTPMGWKERDHYLPAHHKEELFDRNGNIGPTLWWNGRIAGAWATRPDGTIAWRLLDDIGRQGTTAIEEAAARLEALLAGTRVTPRFRTPLERRLAAARQHLARPGPHAGPGRA